MQVQSQHAPFQLEPTAAGLRVTIPRLRSGVLLFVTTVMFAMLGFMAYMDYHAVADALTLEGPVRVFRIVSVLFYTFGCYTLTRMFLCYRGRNETITVNSSALEYRMEIFGMGRTRTYRSHSIQHLRLAAFLEREPARGRGLDLQPLGTNRGFVAFDYEGKTVRLAPALSEENAGQLLKQVAAYLPQR